MIQIHTRAWTDDHASREGERQGASIGCRMFVDGVEIPQVIRARTYHHGNDFTTTVITLVGVVDVVNHTKDSWEAFEKENPNP